jgi:heme/copper-type cytochrome/quinol oxidase subunit 2
MTIRTLALVLAALLAVPAMALLLRPRRGDGDDAPRTPWLTLDGLWTVVPVALLAALVALAAVA